MAEKIKKVVIRTPSETFTFKNCVRDSYNIEECIYDFEAEEYIIEHKNENSIEKYEYHEMDDLKSKRARLYKNWKEIDQEINSIDKILREKFEENQFKLAKKKEKRILKLCEKFKINKTIFSNGGDNLTNHYTFDDNVDWILFNSELKQILKDCRVLGKFEKGKLKLKRLIIRDGGVVDKEFFKT